MTATLHLEAVLDGLIKDGVITEFKTLNGRALGVLHVAVCAPLITDPRVPGYDRKKVLAVRNRVTKELEGAGVRDVMVSVRSSVA